MTAETLSGWVSDPAARKRYVEAFERSDFEAMLNYYKRNYPRGSGAELPRRREFPKVKAPVLMFHGLDDQALHSDGLVGHVELGGEGPHARHRPRRQPLRAAGRRGARHVHDALVVGDEESLIPS